MEKGYPPAGYYEEMMAEELAAKYGFPLEIVRLAINAETDEDEAITENERVDRINFLMKVMDLLKKKHNI